MENSGWTRRKWLKNVALAAGGSMLGLGSAAAYSYSRWVEPSWVEWSKKTIPIPNLPPFWEGKTILHLSDLHAGGAIDPLTMAEWLTEAQKLQPDVVVTTGDIIDSSSRPEQEVLPGLIPQGKIASFWVFGNHDVAARTATKRHAVLRSLMDPSQRVCLENQRIEIEGLAWIGTEDFILGQPTPEKVLKDDGKPVIALAHNPLELDRSCWAGQTGWMLSGHTHGGQICLPGITPLGEHPGLGFSNGNKPHPPQGIALPQSQPGQTMGLHISRGMGQHHPCRFRARPEITLLTLDPRG
jgi:uncharacterized protein